MKRPQNNPPIFSGDDWIAVRRAWKNIVWKLFPVQPKEKPVDQNQLITQLKQLLLDSDKLAGNPQRIYQAASVQRAYQLAKAVPYLSAITQKISSTQNPKAAHIFAAAVVEHIPARSDLVPAVVAAAKASPEVAQVIFKPKSLLQRVKDVIFPAAKVNNWSEAATGDQLVELLLLQDDWAAVKRVLTVPSRLNIFAIDHTKKLQAKHWVKLLQTSQFRKQIIDIINNANKQLKDSVFTYVLSTPANLPALDAKNEQPEQLAVQQIPVNLVVASASDEPSFQQAQVDAVVAPASELLTENAIAEVPYGNEPGVLPVQMQTQAEAAFDQLATPVKAQKTEPKSFSPWVGSPFDLEEEYKKIDILDREREGRNEASQDASPLNCPLEELNIDSIYSGSESETLGENKSNGLNNQTIQLKNLRKEIFQGAGIKGKNSSPGIADAEAQKPASKFGDVEANLLSQFSGLEVNPSLKFSGTGADSASKFSGTGADSASKFSGTSANSASKFSGTSANSASQFSGAEADSTSRFSGRDANSDSSCFSGSGRLGLLRERGRKLLVEQPEESARKSTASVPSLLSTSRFLMGKQSSKEDSAVSGNTSDKSSVYSSPVV